MQLSASSKNEKLESDSHKQIWLQFLPVPRPCSKFLTFGIFILNILYTGPSMKFDKIHSKEDLSCGLICIRFDNLTKFEHFEFVKIAKRRTILVSRESFWFVVSLIWQIQKCSNFVKLSKRMHIRPRDKSSFEWILSNFIDGPVIVMVK